MGLNQLNPNVWFNPNIAEFFFFEFCCYGVGNN
jgi:hypothetical protein